MSYAYLPVCVSRFLARMSPVLLSPLDSHVVLITPIMVAHFAIQTFAFVCVCEYVCCCMKRSAGSL